MIPYRLILFLLITSIVCSAQSIKGIVRDSTNKAPIAFAHITLGDHKTGVTSDIDGKFAITLPTGYHGVIYISHVSYRTQQISSEDWVKRISGDIYLQQQVTNLREVIVLAGENPAWQIIRQVVKNRDRHQPLKYPAFSYRAYTKLVALGEGDPINIDSLVARRLADGKVLSKTDSANLSQDKFFDKNYIFVSESVTEKYFQQPAKHHEKLIAHKVSGFQSPLFASLPNDYQPLGFYDEVMSLLGKDYLNPILKGSENRYDLMLADTLYTSIDTLYVIEYEPLPGSSFNGLKGKVTISTNGYALKNIIAHAADNNLKIGFVVQQNYEFTKGVWFPTQLNTDLTFHEIKFGNRAMSVQARSYLDSIQINPQIEAKQFLGATLDLSDTSGEQLVSTLRPFNLDPREQNTYHLYDSLRDKIKVFKLTDNFSEGLLSSSLPLGKIDLKLDQLLIINQHEGVRLSAALQTNPSFSNWLTLNGYGGYGFKDKTWKYGGFTQFNLDKSRDLYLRVGYHNTLHEAGTQRFFDEVSLISSRALRDWQALNFDRYEAWYGKVGIRLINNWHIQSSIQRFSLAPQYNYELVKDNDLINQFEITELTGELMYAKNQRQVNYKGRKSLLSFEYPVFSFQVHKAMPNLFGADDFNYTRYDLLWMNRWKHRRLGRTHLTLNGGLVDGLAPFNRLYYGRGANETDYWVENHFQTMGINEFASDRYVNLFLTQNFGSIFYNTKFSRPELVISHAMAVGNFQQAAAHNFVTTQSFQEGYFESGLGLYNLLRFNYADVAYMGLGAGVFYRYGAYRHANAMDNLAVRFTLSFSF